MTNNPNDSKYQAALAAATKLSEKSDDALFEELGLRMNDTLVFGHFPNTQEYEAGFTQEAGDMLSTEQLKQFGLRYWKNLEPKLMELVCGSNNAEMQSILGGKSIPEMAASLATAAVVAAFGPPAWVIVGTTILAAKLFDAGLETLCQDWKNASGNQPVTN